MADVTLLRRTFENVYKAVPRLFSAPGRVNLIGEHTDYNDGFVLPMSIDRRTYVAAARRPDRIVNVRSLDVGESAAFSLDRDAQSARNWSTYVEGVARELESSGIKLSGADLIVSSDIPLGAGLSSSAALEISVGLALLEISRQKISARELALAAQRAEHTYVGTKCGIMDQLTVTFGKQNTALLIDCRSQDIKQIPINFSNMTVMVCNTNIKHELATSAYNQRRSECESATSMLKNRLPNISALRDVTICDLQKHGEALPEVLLRRARHVVTENDRTIRAATALEAGDFVELGRLMALSHISLRDEFEVSSPELDLMVELANQIPGVIGARMTGGGFGGCTINLLNTNQIDPFCVSITERYLRIANRRPTIYSVTADDGVSEITL